ncbi:MAG: hypothetical protein U5P10_17875 [Spirochaetia bacterium]|nr:hypothetical protein [Spirochaetia bacterium]
MDYQRFPDPTGKEHNQKEHSQKQEHRYSSDIRIATQKHNNEHGRY